jgi:hypothetical protein
MLAVYTKSYRLVTINGQERHAEMVLESNNNMMLQLPLSSYGPGLELTFTSKSFS